MLMVKCYYTVTNIFAGITGKRTLMFKVEADIFDRYDINGVTDEVIRKFKSRVSKYVPAGMPINLTGIHVGSTSIRVNERFCF